jgi:hypothetical protein
LLFFFYVRTRLLFPFLSQDLFVNKRGRKSQSRLFHQTTSQSILFHHIQANKQGIKSELSLYKGNMYEWR